VRVWRIPYSTNCERVALAAGRVGVAVEWVEVDVDDRTPVQELSGQTRVPIAELDGEIVVGSLLIVGRIAPGLWPSEPRARAQVDVFLEWFERVWLHPLGILWHGEDDDRRKRAGARLARSLDRFEDLLDGSEHLFGQLTVADIAAYPFIKYATDDNADDDYEIHELMRRYQSVDGRPRLAAWIDRVSALPRA
jgi:glutathione S-transferase